MTEKFSGFLKLIPGYVEKTGEDANNKTKTGVANVGASVASGKSQITSLVKQTKNSVVSDYNNMSNSASNSTYKMNQNTTKNISSMSNSSITSIVGMANGVGSWFNSMSNDSQSKASGMAQGVLGSFLYLSKSTQDTTSNMGKGIIGSYSYTSDSSQKIVSGMAGGILGSGSYLNKGMQDTTSNMGKGIIGKLSDASNGAQGEASNMAKGVLGSMAYLLFGITNQDWYNPGTNLVKVLSKGISDKWGSTSGDGLVGGIVALASGLTAALKAAFGIHSPSRLWNKEIGQFLPPGIGLGMESAMPKLLNDASGMATDLTSAFNTSLQFTDPLQDLSDMSADIASSINTDVATSTSTVIDTGRMSTDIASGIVDGMSMSQADQNRLLREQNELLRQLLAKETGISSNDIFESVKRSNRQAYNRTGTNPLLY